MQRKALGNVIDFDLPLLLNLAAEKLEFLANVFASTMANLVLLLICLHILILLTWKFNSRIRRSNLACPNFSIRYLFVILFDSILISSFISLTNRLLLIKSGSVETNPGPKVSKFSFATWNIDSLLARDGSKKDCIEGIDSIHKFDIFCVCETYLTSEIPNEKLMLQGFSPTPLRDDSKTTGRAKGGVCLYFKEHLPLKCRKVLESLDESIVVEIVLNRNKYCSHYSTDHPIKLQINLKIS